MGKNLLKESDLLKVTNLREENVRLYYTSGSKSQRLQRNASRLDFTLEYVFIVTVHGTYGQSSGISSTKPMDPDTNTKAMDNLQSFLENH